MGEKQGKNRTLLALAAPFAATFPQQFPHIPLAFFPFQNVRQAEFIPKTRWFRSKLKPFRGESSPAQGRRKGAIRGEFGHFPSKNPSERG